MKKLMIALSAAAAALFTFGDEVYSAADFEANGYVEGEGFNAALADDGVSDTGDRFWFSTDNTGNVISNHEGSVTAPVPDYFKNENTNDKYLWLDTATAPLFRTIKGNDQIADNVYTNGEVIGANGIYLDTLVKFTAADKAFDSNLDQGDKIAIEYVECDADTDPDGVGYTNFVIRAGQYVNGTLGQANYFATVPEGFSKDAWHRLTVRTIANVSADEQNPVVGFVVYLDMEPLAYTNGNNAAGFGSLNAVAQVFGNSNALYPSAILAGVVGGSTITSASFSGTGAIDDVVFTSTKPEFIAATEQVMVTFTVDAGVSALSVTVGEGQPIAVDMTADPIVCALPSGTTSFTLGVTLDPNGYELVGVTGDTVTSYENDVVTFTGVAPTIAVTTTRDNVSYIDANGDPQTCVSLSEAFGDAGDGATITLAYDISVADTEDAATFAGYQTGSDTYVLDLAGHTIYGGDDATGAPLITVNGTLTIIDSVGGGEIIYDSQYANAGILSLAGSDAFIGDADVDVDAGVKYTGLLFAAGAEGTVVRGYFDVDSNSDSDAFAYTDYLDGDSACATVPVSGYWVVTPAGETPAVLTLSITDGANATYTVTINGTAAATGATIVADDEIVVTATPATGCEYASVPAGWTDAGNGSITKTVTVGFASVSIVIPDATEVVQEYELTITDGANATYTVTINGVAAATGDTIVEDDVIVVTATPDPDYEYASVPTGWTDAGNGSISMTVTVVDDDVEIVIPDATEVEPEQDDYKVVIDGSDVAITLSPEEIALFAAGGLDTPEKVNAFLAMDFGTTGAKVWEVMFLGLDPTDADALDAFKFASITMANGKVTLTMPEGITLQTGRGVDITLNVYGSDDLVNWGSTPLATATDTTTIPAITPLLGETKKFYKVEVEFSATPQP